MDPSLIGEMIRDMLTIADINLPINPFVRVAPEWRQHEYGDFSVTYSGTKWLY